MVPKGGLLLLFSSYLLLYSASGQILVRPDNRTQTCDQAFQTQALQVLHAATDGAHWINNSKWLNTTASCTIKDANGFLPNISTLPDNTPLPSYCCWAGIICCISKTCPNPLVPQPGCNCSTIGMVTTMLMSRNNMTGELPQHFLSSLSCELREVDFSFNNISGQLSDGIHLLERLEVLSLPYNRFNGTLPLALGLLPRLRVVDLTQNLLTGLIPPGFCNGNATSSITDLLFAGNQFTGGFSALSCNNLVQLDLTSNQFNSTLPDLEGFINLRIIRMSNNNFFGSIPADGAYYSTLLTNMDVSNNNLSGSIPPSLSTLRLLSNLRLGNNNFSGTLPEGIFADLGTLQRVDMSSNIITGTLPDVPIEGTGIVSINMYNNSLYGTIPESFSVLARPNTSIDFSLNYLSCCGIDPTPVPDPSAAYASDVYGGVNWTAALRPLPSFLSFSSFQVPVRTRFNATSGYNNMRCPGLKVAGQPDDAANLLNWAIDPDYYMYMGCTCDQGYEMVNVSVPGKPQRMICSLANTPWYVKNPWILVLVVLGGTTIPLGFLILCCYRKGVRPVFMQQYINLRKRVQGEPKEGTISLVTTDIEGYSDLMKREPELMGKGLRIHNYCIDKARWQMYGFTMEQEGDSFTIAFYEPFDAVAFCLQAQLLLNRMEWPERLINAEGGTERSRKGSVLAAALQGAARMLLRDRERSGASDLTHPRHSSSQEPLSPTPGTSGTLDSLGTPSPALPSSSTVAPWGRNRSASASRLLRFTKFGGSGTKRGQLAIPEDTVPAAETGPSISSGTIPYQPASSAGTTLDGPPTGMRLASSGMRSERNSVLNGLRVRMGIVTGKLEKGVSLRSSMLMDKAKVVSDAAAGGQILMDGPTFKAVKERLVELGTVDQNGVSLSKMNMSRPTLLAWMLGKRKVRYEGEAAVVLDMGKYVHSSARGSQGALLSTMNSQHGNTSFRTGTNPSSTPNSGARGTMEQAAAAAVAAVDEGASIPSAASHDANNTRLHLYQILSPSLVERARIFGAKLALKEDWVCRDVPYFSAPGAAAAGLGLDSSAIIPPITMVFCSVEGVKDWKLGSDKAKRNSVQQIIRNVIINTLMACQGGYLCRLQEDEFKYMVAFSAPEEAAKWCLLMQDALLWQDWPDWLLRLDKLREERDERNEVIWRGPRLRMGLCHGCPRAIVPDHMGRADYHGASINSAARYMDAAAHGGQVVCEEETALAIINTFNNLLRPAEPLPLAAPAPPASTPGTSFPSEVVPELELEMDAAAANSVGLPKPLDAGILDSQATGVQPLNNETVRSMPPGAFRALSAPAVTFAAQPAAPLATPEERVFSDSYVMGQQPGFPLGLRNFPGPNSPNGTPRLQSMGTLSSIKELDDLDDMEGSGEERTTPTDSTLAASAPSHSNQQTDSSGQQASSSDAGLINPMFALPTGAAATSPAVQGARQPNLIDTGSPTTAMPSAADLVRLTSSTFALPSSADRLQETAVTREDSQRLTFLEPSAASAPPAPPPARGWQEGFQSPTSNPEGSGPYMFRLTNSATSPRTPPGVTVPSTSRLARTAGALPTGITQPTDNRQNDQDADQVSGESAQTMRRADRQTIRLSLPDGPSGRTNRSLIPYESDRSMNSTVFHNPNSFCTGITALRIGSFKFKGSPEEVPMAQLLLDTLAGRRFPSDPPRGKGGRVRIASGLLAAAPVVELPNVSRLYCLSWRARYETIQPPTPRMSARNVKGWAVSIIASRSNSLNATAAGDVHPGPAGAALARSSGGGISRTGLAISSMMGRSKNLLDLMRAPSRQTPSRRSLATQSEFNLSNLDPRMRGTGSNNGRTAAMLIQEDDMRVLHHRSDSISSFIVAAEEGLLAGEGEETPDNTLVSEPASYPEEEPTGNGSREDAPKPSGLREIQVL